MVWESNRSICQGYCSTTTPQGYCSTTTPQGYCSTTTPRGTVVLLPPWLPRMVSKFTFVDDGAERIDLDEEVVLEEDESNDGEEIDQDDCEDGGQEDGPAVLGH